ncbi:MAG TPA: hypothetical protein VK117_05895 [Pyrinomonadaceae bacterium]|nr:hypothetical protein [Pyrinomonadaceae bacterium]
MGVKRSRQIVGIKHGTALHAHTRRPFEYGALPHERGHVVAVAHREPSNPAPTTTGGPKHEQPH